MAPSAAAAAAGADVVLLAVPVRSLGPVAAAIAPVLAPGALVTDVGSTKAGVVAECEATLAGRGRFVGGHPLAGTERAGPDAAEPDLFRGKMVLLTPTPATDEAALAEAEALWRAVGAAEVRRMTPHAHDRALAAVSHLPHVAAYALVATLAARGVGDLVGLTGGGFTDTTRISSTPPGMWVDAFLENRAEILPLVDALAERIATLRAAIAAGDGATIERLLTDARAARERILGR
jgi:prephenate dehydrogenase